MHFKRILALALSAVLMLSLVACAPEEVTVTYPPVSLSDNPFDFEFALNGHKYTLPAPYQEFVENKWAFVGDWDTELPEYSHFQEFQIFYDGKEANSAAALFNSTGTALPAKDCKIGEFTVTYSATETLPQIELSMGITMQSTYEDIVAAYGEPDYESDEMINTIIYYADDFTYIEFSIDTRSGLIHTIRLVNYMPDDSYFE